MLRIGYMTSHVVNHCNLNCSGCGHFSNLSKPDFIDPVWYDKQISRISKLCKIGKFYIMGGEPLMHPQVTDFLRSTRKYLPKTTIELRTNGILLSKANQELYRSLSSNRIQLAVMHYPGVKLDRNGLIKLSKEFKFKLLLMENRVWFELFNHKGDSDSNKAFRNCFTKNCSVLHEGRLYLCARPAYVGIYNQVHRKNITMAKSEFIDIFSKDAKEELLRYYSLHLWGVQNFTACRLMGLLSNIELLDRLALKLHIGKPLEFCRWCPETSKGNRTLIPWGTS